METKNLIVVLLALVIGLGAGYAFGNEGGELKSNDHMMPDGNMMHGASMDMDDMMESMMSGLDGKTGDAFDKAFLEEMIVHHQGAVAMAEATQKNAKHEEIRKMGTAIISAQTLEIKQMQEWLKEWYGTPN